MKLILSEKNFSIKAFDPKNAHKTFLNLLIFQQIFLYFNISFIFTKEKSFFYIVFNVFVWMKYNGNYCYDFN